MCVSHACSIMFQIQLHTAAARSPHTPRTSLNSLGDRGSPRRGAELVSKSAENGVTMMMQYDASTPRDHERVHGGGSGRSTVTSFRQLTTSGSGTRLSQASASAAVDFLNNAEGRAVTSETPRTPQTPRTTLRQVLLLLCNHLVRGHCHCVVPHLASQSYVHKKCKGTIRLYMPCTWPRLLRAVHVVRLLHRYTRDNLRCDFTASVYVNVHVYVLCICVYV
jgi:hypothetical protein